MHSIRFSNVARYTSNFTPKTQPFNSIAINITNQTRDKIDFNISKLGQEVVNKIEVLVNGQVSKTYTEIGDLTYNIHSNSLSYGEKVIIRVTFDNDYIEEKEFNYEYKIDNLPTSSSLKELIDRQELLTNSIEVQKNTLKSILESKNVEVSEEENKLSILIQKVNKLVDVKLWLYKDGDECVDITGGWDFNNFSYTDTFQKNIERLTKQANSLYGELSTYWSAYYRGTTEKINLSKYNKLYCMLDKFTAASNSFVQLYVSSDEANYGVKKPVASAFIFDSSVNTVLEIDLRDINSSYNVFIGIFNSSASGGTGANVTVSKIWLEK